MSDALDPPRYAPEELPRKTDVNPTSFFALDLRAGRIVKVEEFPETRTPAWKIDVYFGPLVGTLSSSAQITNYTKSDLEGRMVVGAINLGTKRIAGFASEFLVLGAYDVDGTVRLLQLEEGVTPGAPIG